MEKFTCSNCVAARTKCDYLQKKRAREEELKANELSQDQAQEPVKCSYCEAQDFACVIRSRKAVIFIIHLMSIYWMNFNFDYIFEIGCRKN